MKIALGFLGTALALTLWTSGCSDAASAPAESAALDLRGTRIDGSDDRSTAKVKPAPELEVAIEQISSTEESAIATEVEPDVEDQTVGVEEPSDVEGDQIDAADSEPSELEAKPSRDENAELGILRIDGVRELTFKDLSLEGIDYELLVDSLLFPEEYEDDGVDLPANIAALSGQKVELQGYMIPGKIARGGNVRDFMLVRDLLACCFGGIPKPDEWVDVVMAEDAEAEYIRYLPLVVTGTLSVGEDMDVDAFNPAVFQLVGIEVRRRE